MNTQGLRRVTARALIIGLLAAVGVGTLSGCEKPDWKSPDYISKRLEEGDTTARTIAIKHISDLKEADQKKVAPALAKVYMDGGGNQKDAMQILVQLRVPAAKGAYLKELHDNATGYASACAEALAEIGDKGALPDMVSMYKSSDDVELKQGLLRAFTHMPDPQMVGMLTDTLNLDPDNYPIALHAYSCDILGDIAQKSPQAINLAAKKALVRGLFLSNTKNQNTAEDCGLAVQQLGSPIVPLLLETFQGKNKSVNTLLLKYDQPPAYAFTQNHAKGVATVRLAALKSKKAVDPILEDLKSKKEAPKQLSGQHAVGWRTKEGQDTSEELLGLGDIGDKKATDVLSDVVKGKYVDDEWDDITDGFVELQLRQDAGTALVRLGNREAASALLDMAKKGVIIDLEKRAAMIQNTKNPMPILQRYQFNWMMAQDYADLAGADGLDGLVALIKETKEPELKKKYKSFIPMLKEGAKCLKRGKPEQQAKCFDGMLASKNALVREKAAYELSRLPAQVAGPVVAKHLVDDHLETRELLTFAGYRVPTKGLVDALDKVLDKEADKTTKPYHLDHNRLKLLRAWLKNNMAAVAAK